MPVKRRSLVQRVKKNRIPQDYVKRWRNAGFTKTEIRWAHGEYQRQIRLGRNPFTAEMEAYARTLDRRQPSILRKFKH